MLPWPTVCTARRHVTMSCTCAGYTYLVVERETCRRRFCVLPDPLDGKSLVLYIHPFFDDELKFFNQCFRNSESRTGVVFGDQVSRSFHD